MTSRAALTDAELRRWFEHEFHSRTLAYRPEFIDDGRPVVIVIPDEAHSPVGHALAHCLVNLLARAHRRIVIVGDVDRPLMCPSFFAARTLRAATVELALAINPYIDVEAAGHVPTGERLISLGIGPAGADLDLGADCWVAQAGVPVSLGASPTSTIGALLAACLGSFAAFAELTGVGSVPRGSWSAWDYLASADGQGPEIDAPIDVGRVLCVGAGAVASSFFFFGSFVGLSGEWAIVDGDAVDVSNLNRQLAFMAAEAGWPRTEPVNKAVSVCDRLGPHARSSAEWYRASEGVAAEQYDVILALANEHGVRVQLAHRQATVLLHATTSGDYEAQAHRHVAGHDDCLACRLPEGAPKLKCSEGELPSPDGQVSDAALPFLSATAGLLVLVQLVRLQAGQLLDARHNFNTVDFKQSPLGTSRRIFSCTRSCRARLPPTRRLQFDEHSRWLGLDAELAGAA